MPTKHIQLHIDLSGLSGRMQRALKAASNFVAIGLNASPNITQESFTIPNITTLHEFDANNPWTTEEAQSAWNTWILRSGFRDAAEAIGGVLEEVQSVLSFWKIGELQKEKGTLLGKDWTSIVEQRAQQFHRRTFPQRIEFLEERYSFKLDGNLLDQINTLNIARNCLTHREGVVSKLDVNVQDALELRWSALVTFIMEDGQEVEIVPPHFIKAGTEVSIGIRPRNKTIAIGQKLQVTAAEFAQISLTCFLFAQSCGTLLEAYGRQRGIQFGGSPA